MSSYLSNILTQTTSRYASLRRTLLHNEDDGDTEDDSHISRVLRAYYVEKGRPFPSWLPPDPNDRRAITPAPYGTAAAGSGGQGYYNKAYGAVQAQGQPGGGNSQRSSLSDLWDTPSGNNAAPMQPQSLRNARRPQPPPQQQQTGSTLAPRPLPSQRAGSYQSISSQRSGGVPAGYDNTSAPPTGTTAQDRLKAKLWGAGGRAPSPAQGGSGGASPYQQQDRGGNAAYDSGGGRRW